MDVVYTWVDGSLAGYDGELRSHARTEDDLNPNRYRDNLELLKYSLRSLEAHVPWHGRVYLVTKRPQRPSWLDPSAAGLAIVHHDELMDARHLPTFNSLAIVCNLHRIPAISARFLYVEDDRLFGRDVSPEDLVAREGRVVLYRRLTPSQAAPRRDDPAASPWDRAVALSNHLLDRRYGRSRRGSLKYAPVVIDVARFERFVAAWPEAWETTSSSRFRGPGNIAPEHMFPYFLLHEGEAVALPALSAHRHTGYAGLDNRLSLTAAQLAQLALRRPKFFCLNDNFGARPSARVERWVRAWLERRYPTPSRFERRA